MFGLYSGHHSAKAFTQNLELLYYHFGSYSLKEPMLLKKQQLIVSD